MKTHNMEYRSSYITISKGWMGIENDCNERICSELCAEYLISLGLVEKHELPILQSIMPSSFGLNKCKFPSRTFMYNKPIIVMECESKYGWKFFTIMIIIIVILLIIVMLRREI